MGHLVKVILFEILISAPSGQILNGQIIIDEEQINIVNREIENLVHETSKSTFSGSILVAKAGQEIVRQHYGWTNIDSTALIGSNARFNVGSLAKEIPAVSILDLILKGRLSYEDTVDKFIKYLPEWSKHVTIVDLLFYKSGLPPLNFRKVQSDQQGMDLLSKLTRLPFEPGSRYLYNNWNNFLLTRIVEEVTDTDFDSWVHENYFDKLEIRNSFYGSTAPEETHNMTRAFTQKFGDDEVANPNFKHFKLCYAPLYMTIHDVYKWIEFIFSKHTKHGQISRRFFQSTNLHQQGPLGIIQHYDGGVSIHRHGGYAYSYGCLTYRDYEHGITIILMTNKNEGFELKDLQDRIMEALDSNGIR